MDARRLVSVKQMNAAKPDPPQPTPGGGTTTNAVFWRGPQPQPRCTHFINRLNPTGIDRLVPLIERRDHCIGWAMQVEDSKIAPTRAGGAPLTSAAQRRLVAEPTRAVEDAI